MRYFETDSFVVVIMNHRLENHGAMVDMSNIEFEGINRHGAGRPALSVDLRHSLLLKKKVFCQTLSLFSTPHNNVTKLIFIPLWFAIIPIK